MDNEQTVATSAAGQDRGRWLALGALTLSGLVLGLDGTILITALPTLSAKLGATTSELQWISAAYTLALAGLMLPAGVLADRLGRKRLLIAGLVLFGISSVVASQMTTATGLIVMRALMGASGAIILPLMQGILPSIFSEKERPRAVAVAGVGTFLGLPLGPLVAGWLLTHFDWGSVFLINAPVVLLALLGTFFFIPESRDEAAPRLDWIGAVLEVIGVTALVYGIIEQPAHGWADGRVLVGLIGGAVLVVLFVAWELTRRAPLVNLRFFTNPRFSWGTAAFAVAGFVMTGVMFVVSPYLQLVEGTDAQGTGIRLLPLIGAVIVGAVATDRLAGRVPTRFVIGGGFLLSAAGMIILSRADAGTGYGLVAVSLAVMGLGVALGMLPSLVAILDSLPESETGAGSGLTRTLQNVGASFGVAIMGSLLNAVYLAQLDPHLAGLPGAARDVARNSLAGATAVAHHLPGGLGVPLLSAARDAYSSGMSEVLLVTAAMSVALALLVAVFMPDKQPKTETAEASTKAVGAL
jgi:EmrB/QacA subfamily drug resistance transporter